MKKVFLLIPATALIVSSLGYSQSTSPKPVRGGVLNIALNVEPPQLDPTQAAGAETQRIINLNVLEGLLGIDETGKIVPRLATVLPKISSDGLEYTFTLRRGVKFHDGSNFDSSDVKAKFDRARNRDSGHASPTYYTNIASVSAPNADTVVFKLTRSNTEFLYNIARAESTITPSELIASKEGLEKLKTNPIGTGPFQLKTWNRGNNIILERNPNYYLRGLPYLDGVTYRFYGDDQNARVAAIKTGVVDVIGVPAEQAAALKNDPQLKVFSGASSGEITVSFNNQRKPFDDVRVRRALTLAANKKAIVDGAFFGYGTVIGSFNSPGQPYYINLANRYSFNPEQAKRLLAQAGYPNGFSVKFRVAAEYPIERRSAEVYAAQLEQIGVKVDIEIISFNQWLTQVFTNKDYDLTIIGHAESFDLDRYARDGYYFNWDNREYKALYERAIATPDTAARTRLYWQAQTLLADQAPGVWLFSAAAISATRANVYGWWSNAPTPNQNLLRVFKTQ